MLGGAASQLGQQRFHALVAELLLLLVHALVDAVRAEDDNIAHLQGELLFLVVDVGQDAERHAVDADLLHPPAADQTGPGEAGVGNRQHLALRVVERESEGHEAVVNARLAQVSVHQPQHFRRLAGMLDHVPAQDADGERAVESGGGGLAGHVARGHAQPAVAVGEEVEDVAAELPRRHIADGDVEPGHPRGRLRQQPPLDVAGHFHVHLQAALILADFFVQPGVLEGDGDVGGQGGEHLLVLLGESVVLGAFEIQHADEAVLDHQGHHQLGVDVDGVAAGDVARVEVDVGDAHRLAQGGRGAADADAHRQPGLNGQPLVEAQREGVLEQLRLLVPEHHVKAVVVHQPLDALRHPPQQLFAVEDGGQLPADFVQERQGARLLAQVLVKPGVLDGVGQVPGQEGEEALVAVGEGVAAARADVEDADGAGLDHQGDGHLRADAFAGADVARVVADVADAHRLAGLGRRAHQTLPQAQAPVLDHFLRVADAEADAQLLPERVEQVDAESVVVDVRLDAHGHLAEDFVEVERGVELFGHLEQAADDVGFTGRARAGVGSEQGLFVPRHLGALRGSQIVFQGLVHTQFARWEPMGNWTPGGLKGCIIQENARLRQSRD